MKRLEVCYHVGPLREAGFTPGDLVLREGLGANATNTLVHRRPTLAERKKGPTALRATLIGATERYSSIEQKLFGPHKPLVRQVLLRVQLEKTREDVLICFSKLGLRRNEPIIKALLTSGPLPPMRIFSCRVRTKYGQRVPVIRIAGG